MGHDFKLFKSDVHGQLKGIRTGGAVHDGTLLDLDADLRTFKLESEKRYDVIQQRLVALMSEGSGGKQGPSCRPDVIEQCLSGPIPEGSGGQQGLSSSHVLLQL